jgi:hypothetical protein
MGELASSLETSLAASPKRIKALKRALVAAAGHDIALNAVGVPHVQGTPLSELSCQGYTNFLAEKAAARHMAHQGSGVNRTPSTPGSRKSGFGSLDME